MNELTILSLDLGTKTGWALARRGIVSAGLWDLSPRRFDGGGIRYLRFRDRLEEALQDVDRVVFEEVRRHLGTGAAHVYGGLQAHLMAECEVRRIPYEGVPVGTIKKHATGKGNAPKKAMVAAAVERFPTIDVQDDNVADALCLLDWARSNQQ